jgi:tRNA nucleotidyltransferase (CCA-adding enzyme)
MISEEAIVQAVRAAVPPELLVLSQTMTSHGHHCWIVGGSVRDVLWDLERGGTPRRRGDWDLATSAHPEEVKKVFRKVIPTGIEHGTVTVVLGGHHFEVTTLRGERGHSDGRRPDEVFYVDDLAEDLARRDFTVNAMAVSLEDNSFHDPFSGREDLSLRLLRAVGAPAQRFSEDGLRILRCARFCSTLDFDVEVETRKAIRPSLSTFEKVARERVRDEWFKALGSSLPSRFLRLVREEGMLELTIPGLWDSSESDSRFSSALEKIDAAPQDPELRLALLVSLQIPAEPTTIQARARSLALTFGRCLKLSKKEQGQIERLASYGHLPASLMLAPSGEEARRWIREVGRAHAGPILDYQRLVGSNADGSAARREIVSQMTGDCPLSLSELAVTGGDLISQGVVPKGPAVGQVLAHLLDCALARPEDNTRERLFELAQDFSED